MRIYKTPSRRRLKKWRSRTERIIDRAGARGSQWFIRQVLMTSPLQKAAKRIGEDVYPRRYCRVPAPITIVNTVAFATLLTFANACDHLSKATRKADESMHRFYDSALGESW
jgi:hypothetical protein